MRQLVSPEPLWSHQLRAVNDYATRRKALLWSPRLGKSRASLEAYTAAAHAFDYTRLIIVAPKVVCPQWTELLAKYEYSNIIPAYGMSVKEARETIKKHLFKRAVVVVNYDKLPLKDRGVRLAEMLMGFNADGLIVDESHYCKDPRAGRTKTLHRIARDVKWLRLLTGTAAPNHYGNLWSQFVMVNPERWYERYHDFAARYLIMNPMFPTMVQAHINVNELQAKLQIDADIVRREDVFGADQYQIVTRFVTLPTKARVLYTALVDDWIANVDGKESPEIRADHALKRMTRLRQIGSGFVVDEHMTDGNKYIKLHDAKIAAVAADLNEIIESGEKAVLFHQYTWEGEQYFELAQSLTNFSYRIYGGTDGDDRAKYVKQFNEAPGGAVLIAQTASAGIGISLASATHALFTTQGFSFAQEEQARDRIYAPGKPKCITYYRARETVDDFIAKALATKQNVHDAVRTADIRAMAYGRIK
jgi:SWI/SNF-related matrix-associated actin-dependent regulator 1 of chromatin subfamily A